MEKIKIALADDHKLFRKGLISILKDYDEIASIIEAENGKELLELMEAQPPDVILLDLNMPVMNGWGVLAELKKRTWNLKVLIVSMYEDESFVVGAIQNGAHGFLSKNADPEEIVLAIHSVMQTGYYFNDKTNKTMLKKMMMQETISPISPNGPIELTPREKEVLQLIADELSGTEIADKLVIGERTVDMTRHLLLEKFGAKNSVGLVLNAFKRGFIQF